jgi:hypothetical protein
MSSPRRRALLRFVRGLAYAALAAAIDFALGQVPELGDAIPASELSIPVLTASLLAADKWVREHRAASVPPS